MGMDKSSALSQKVINLETSQDLLEEISLKIQSKVILKDEQIKSQKELCDYLKEEVKVICSDEVHSVMMKVDRNDFVPEVIK